jgi:hypothetical protein
VIINYRSKEERDIVLGYARLLKNLDDLHLDVDGHEALRERVDLDEAGVDGASEATELGDEADGALLDGAVGVRVNDAAKDRVASAHDRAEDVNHGAVLAVADDVVLVGHEDLCVRRLQVLEAGRLDADDGDVGVVEAAFAVEPVSVAAPVILALVAILDDDYELEAGSWLDGSLMV